MCIIHKSPRQDLRSSRFQSFTAPVSSKCLMCSRRFFLMLSSLSKVFGQLSHRSFNDRTLRSEPPHGHRFRRVSTFIYFNILPHLTRRINRHTNHARFHERKQGTLAARARSDVLCGSNTVALRLWKRLCAHAECCNIHGKSAVSRRNVLTNTSLMCSFHFTDVLVLCTIDSKKMVERCKSSASLLHIRKTSFHAAQSVVEGRSSWDCVCTRTDDT